MTCMNLEWPCFINRYTEGYLLFRQNYNMTFGSSENHTVGAKVQYLLTLIHCEALGVFEDIFVQVRNTITMHLNQILFGLDMFFFPVKYLNEKECVVRYEMRNLRKFKARSYIAHTIEFYECLDSS